MKILSHTPETVTVDHDGKVLIHNLDKIRANAIYGERDMEILREFLKYRLRNKGLL